MRNFYNYRYPRAHEETGTYPHGRMANRPRAGISHYGMPDIGGYEIELMTDLLRRQQREREELERDILSRRHGNGSNESGFLTDSGDRAGYGRSVIELDKRFLDEYDYDAGARAWYTRMRDEVASWLGDENAGHRRELDAFLDGNRGRGPKNFVRSDMRILEDLGDLLTDDPFVDATDITVKVKEGNVELKGSVPSRHSKRRAEDLAYCVSGVKDVRDEMWIDPDFYVNARGSGTGEQLGADEKSVARSA